MGSDSILFLSYNLIINSNSVFLYSFVCFVLVCTELAVQHCGKPSASVAAHRCYWSMCYV